MAPFVPATLQSAVNCLLLLTSLSGLGIVGSEATVIQHAWRHVFTLDVIPSDVNLTTTARSKFSCASFCSDEQAQCVSFGYHAGSRVCLLFNHLVEYTTDGAAAAGVSYFWPRGRKCPTHQNFNLTQGICWLYLLFPLQRQFATTFCRTRGAHLYAGDSNHALGVLQFLATTPIWIGAKKFSTPGTFRWVTGKELVAENWYPGGPSSEATKGCVMLNSARKFENINCMGLPHAFYCQFPL